MPITDPPPVTVPMRKAAERTRRIRAADERVARMRAYAECEGGRFVVSGSFATGGMGHDSDLVGMIDVPAAGRRGTFSKACRPSTG